MVKKEVNVMKTSNINVQDIIFSLDIGTRSVIGAAGIVRDKKLNIIAESYMEHKERSMIDGQIHDINLVADAVAKVKKDIEAKVGFELKNVAIAAAGRFLRTITVKSEMSLDSEKEITRDTIRSLELTAVKKAEQEVMNESNGKLYCVGYSVKNYYLNGYVISNLLYHKAEEIAAEIIATFLPRSVIESLYSVIDKVGLNVISLTLEPIAAIEAAIPSNLRLLNLALVDIGAGTSDIAISSKDSICAYGMVPLAGDEVTEAIAQNYLVDFNTAERIKRECGIKDNVTYIDIMGLENEVTSEEVNSVINPVVNKIADEIAIKIIDLNGGKSPNAVFLVGGGAHTPNIRELIAEKLNIPLQRLGIKGVEAVKDCVCDGVDYGSAGVTVLGIALISIKQLGHDFIDVTLNGSVISLFNSHKHTVMDVLLQSGVNPKLLMGKNGKNIRFELNGIKRLAFGTLATGSEITINGLRKNLDSEVWENDKIEVKFACDGKDAEPKIKDFITELYSISFYMNDAITSIEPIAYVNNDIESPDYTINEGDMLNIIYIKTIDDFRRYILKDDSELKKDDIILKGDYIIKDGDKIYSSIKSEPLDEAAAEIIVENSVESSKKSINVIVNDERILLNGKEKYIFIDIFDYIEFDLSIPRGNLILVLNGEKAGYYDILKDGDIIKIYWDKN